jgi:hypothetical protein
MPGILEGQMANAIYAGFKGKLLTGTLVRHSPSDLELDLFGDPVSLTGTSFSCEGFVEKFSEYYRAVTGVPDTDVKVMIFAKSISTEPTTDDIVVFRDIQYQIRKILEIDPAIATYTLQCFEIKHGS